MKIVVMISFSIFFFTNMNILVEKVYKNACYYGTHTLMGKENK